MARFLAFLCFTAALLTSAKVMACEGSDRPVGPLCIERGKVQAGSRGYAYERARFEDDVYKKVVWEGVGEVQEATRTRMVVIEQRTTKRGLEDVEVTYVWNGQKFIEKRR